MQITMQNLNLQWIEELTSHNFWPHAPVVPNSSSRGSHLTFCVHVLQHKLFNSRDQKTKHFSSPQALHFLLIDHSGHKVQKQIGSSTQRVSTSCNFQHSAEGRVSSYTKWTSSWTELWTVGNLKWNVVSIDKHPFLVINRSSHKVQNQNGTFTQMVGMSHKFQYNRQQTAG